MWLALRSAPIVISSRDRDFQATWAFANGKELDLSGSGMIGLFAPGHAERYSAVGRMVIANGIGQRAELDLVIDGKRHTYDFRIEPSVDNGVVIGVHAVGFDITPSKLAEESLREADHRKDEFLATLSHELRNPLTPLRVASDVARLSMENPDRLVPALGVIDRQIGVLVHLVDDLLDVARITQGKIQLDKRPTDPILFVEAALEATRSLFETARHEVRVELPKTKCLVIGDQARLTQVLVNLLSNAAKYTPSNGHIAIELADDRDRGVLVIRVSDDGIGITPELLPRAFEMFVQASEDLDRTRGGLGIGLNLVRRLVELHDGAVSVQSDGANHGSTFIVELPLVPRSN